MAPSYPTGRANEAGLENSKENLWEDFQALPIGKLGENRYAPSSGKPVKYTAKPSVKEKERFHKTLIYRDLRGSFSRAKYPVDNQD